MPNFIYTCMNEDGVKSSGSLFSLNLDTLEQELKEKKLWLINADAEKKEILKQKRKIKFRIIIDFFVQLYVMTKAGIPIISALTVIHDETEDEYFKAVVGDIVLNIESGKSFEDCLSDYPYIFDKLAINSIKAGGQTGLLENSLKHLIGHYEWSESIRGHIKKASLYPIILSVGIVMFTFFMFTFVVPKFVTLLTSFHVALPLPTRIMFAINDFFASYGLFLIVGLGCSVFVSMFMYKTNKKYKFYFDKLKLTLPVIGEVNEMIIMSRFLHNLSALLGSGILIIDALKISSESMDNEYFENIMLNVVLDIENGDRLATSLTKHKLFKPMVRRMIAIGEDSGNIEEILDYIYEYYDKEIPKKVDMTIVILTQIVTLVLGLIVALIALSVFMPMMDMTQMLKRR